MAYPVTLNGRTYTLADFEGNNYVDGLPDAFEDFVTHAGDIYNDTSTTSNSIGTGSKTFTVASGKPYQAGTPLRIADAAAPATNFLDAVVTSYSGTTLVVEAIGYGGSGTKTSWTVNIGGAKTIDGTLGVSQGGTGATTAAAARTNLETYSKTEADSRFLNVSGEASDVTMTGNVTIGDAGSDTLTIGASILGDVTINNAGNTDSMLRVSEAADTVYFGGNGNGKANIYFDAPGETAPTYSFFGDSDTGMYWIQSDNLGFATGGQERARINSGGVFMVNGSANPGLGSFVLGNTSASREDINIITSTTGVGHINFADGTSGSNRYVGSVNYTHADNDMYFTTSNGERVRITSEGAFLVGTQNREVYYNSVNAYNASAVVKTNVSNEVADIVITNGNNDFGSSIDFARTNTAGNDVRFATISAAPTNNTAGSEAGAIRFYTKNTTDSNVNERARFDATGHFLFGKTSTSSATPGIRFAYDAPGYAEFTRDGGNPLFLNRETSAGDIIRFAQDNSTMGGISVATDAVTIGAGDVGLFFNAGGDNIFPTGSGATALSGRDAAVDIGRSAYRFKDLYLSGGVFLGGAVSANKLDDYEEGTFTPVFAGVSAATYDSLATQGRYVKIGRMVWVTAVISTTALTKSGGAVKLSLPFSVSYNQANYTPPSVFIEDGFNPAGGAGNVQGLSLIGDTSIALYTIASSTGVNYTNVTYNDLQASATNRIRYSVCFEV